MDLSSGIAVYALDVQPGDHVLDICCAPGNSFLSSMRMSFSLRYDDWSAHLQESTPFLALSMTSQVRSSV